VSALATTLTQLGDAALSAGDAETAHERFVRAVAAAPRDPAARAGLGRSLVALGRDAEARAALEMAIAGNADSVEARLGLAEIEARAGNLAGAETHLAHAVAVAPARPDAHERYAALTGPAPPTDATDAATRIARAERHPYDPIARLAAGDALLARGDPAGAREHFETALVLADLDPVAARDATERLRTNYPEWRTRRVVAVQVLADEALRADPAWRFQLRFAWIGVSQALAPLLDVSFVVTSVAPFRSASAGYDLPAITAAARAVSRTALGRRRPASRRGCLAEAARRVEGRQAELLGRVPRSGLRAARSQPRARAQVVHLYGGVHVSRKSTR
jgi:tetratricopeptide (TPR) repeat protein